MFNLGYKQLIMNGDVGVTENGTVITVPGFGVFDTAQRFPNGGKWKAVAVDAAVGEYTATPVAGQAIAGAYYNVKVYLKGAPRILSELFPGGGSDFDDAGSIFVFQTTKLTAVDTIGDALKAAVIPGFNDTIIDVSGSAGNAMKFKFQPGYEGVGIAKVSFTNADDQDNEETFILAASMTEDTIPSEGIGLGKQLETDVRNATYDNIDPYGIQFGGSSAVDVRGKYTTYYFEMKGAGKGMGNDWEPHAMLGYGDANTETMYGPVKFIIYANEASVPSAAITILDKLTA